MTVQVERLLVAGVWDFVCQFKILFLEASSRSNSLEQGSNYNRDICSTVDQAVDRCPLYRHPHTVGVAPSILDP